MRDKVALGAAAGVGVAALAPVLAPVGVVTALGAALFGGAGAAGGAAAAAMGRKPGTKGEAAAAAAAAEDEARLKRAESIRKYMADVVIRERFLIALYAVSICAAGCGGSVTEDAMRDIREAVQGLGKKMSSEELTEAIEKLFVTPPSVTVAAAYALEFRDGWEEFDDAVEAGLASGLRPAKSQAAFREAWGLAASQAGIRSRYAMPLLTVQSVVSS